MMDFTKPEGLMKYDFTSTFRKYKEDDACGWNFLFMPEELAKEIRENFKWREEGWGRMKVTAKIGGSEWKTSIWFDTKHDTYLLPVKAEIRKKEKIEMEAGKEIRITIWI
jgi:hypothetical protein